MWRCNRRGEGNFREGRSATWEDRVESVEEEEELVQQQMDKQVGKQVAIKDGAYLCLVC